MTGSGADLPIVSRFEYWRTGGAKPTAMPSFGGNPDALEGWSKRAIIAKRRISRCRHSTRLAAFPKLLLITNTKLRKGQAMLGLVNFGYRTMSQLITRAWRALTAPGVVPNPAKEKEPLRMSDVHPYGSCARNWRPADFSDLFEPETFTDKTADAEQKRR